MKKLLIAVLMVPTLAHAEFFTGNQLLGLIQSREVMERMQALGYIQGVFDANTGATICPPSGINAGQIHDMVKNYLENTPATRHRSADRIIYDVFKTLWPCSNRAPSRGA